MRLFFALSFPQEIIEYLTRAQHDLRQALSDVRGLSWPVPANMHLTLEFLGDVAPNRVPDLSAAAQTAAASYRPFDAQLQDAGAFPSADRAAVLWCGIGAGRESVIELQASLRRALHDRQVKTENRRYQPHVTLARVRNPAAPEAIRQALSLHARSSLWRVTSIELIESQLLPSGARYTQLERFPLYRQETSDVE